MIPYKMKWRASRRSHLARDDELLDLAAPLGLRHPSIGLESVKREASTRQKGSICRSASAAI